jgi:hypothetical protein
MDRSVPLDRLPDGLTFPPELAGRISYDESQRKLSFQGFMCKAEFDRLHRLHEDWGYRRSLEELFRRCSLDPEPGPANRLASIFSRLIPGRARSNS